MSEDYDSDDSYPEIPKAYQNCLYELTNNSPLHHGTSMYDDEVGGFALVEILNRRQKIVDENKFLKRFGGQKTPPKNDDLEPEIPLPPVPEVYTTVSNALTLDTHNIRGLFKQTNILQLMLDIEVERQRTYAFTSSLGYRFDFAKAVAVSTAANPANRGKELSLANFTPKTIEQMGNSFEKLITRQVDVEEQASVDYLFHRCLNGLQNSAPPSFTKCREPVKTVDFLTGLIGLLNACHRFRPETNKVIKLCFTKNVNTIIELCSSKLLGSFCSTLLNPDRNRPWEDEEERKALEADPENGFQPYMLFLEAVLALLKRLLCCRSYIPELSTRVNASAMTSLIQALLPFWLLDGVKREHFCCWHSVLFEPVERFGVECFGWGEKKKVVKKSTVSTSTETSNSDLTPNPNPNETSNPTENPTSTPVSPLNSNLTPISTSITTSPPTAPSPPTSRTLSSSKLLFNRGVNIPTLLTAMLRVANRLALEPLTVVEEVLNSPSTSNDMENINFGIGEEYEEGEELAKELIYIFWSKVKVLVKRLELVGTEETARLFLIPTSDNKIVDQLFFELHRLCETTVEVIGGVGHIFFPPAERDLYLGRKIDLATANVFTRLISHLTLTFGPKVYRHFSLISKEIDQKNKGRTKKNKKVAKITAFVSIRLRENDISLEKEDQLKSCGQMKSVKRFRESELSTSESEGENETDSNNNSNGRRESTRKTKKARNFSSTTSPYATRSKKSL